MSSDHSVRSSSHSSRRVAVVEIDTVLQAVSAYRVLQKSEMMPGSSRYDALVKQANRVVAEALERVRETHGYAHIMVAPVLAEPSAELEDATDLTVKEIEAAEARAWDRRRSSRRSRVAA